MKLRRNIGLLGIVALLAAASSASGYYHFVHYVTKTSGYAQIREKFDLNALVNNTVTYVIAQGGLEKMADGDSLNSLVSQIHLAARTWSSVPTSRLNLAFGGFVKPGAPSSAPEIEVVFGEIPPGLLATGGPTTRADLAGTDDSKFVPILKSTLILNKDLSAQPVWSESFFMTLTHEMGHTLGLQHTLASSVMSTQVTRAMSKALPLGDDDRAGVSALYPTADFATRFGSISGRVTAGADGMNLASVVALTLDGTAISALTNPDGTYRIDGLPPGNYFIYAHPLPPALSGESYPANITPPTEIGGSPIPASGAFDSLFYPGVKQVDNASVVVVKAGEATENLNFAVTRRDSIPVYAVTTYSYPSGQVPVKPAYQSPAYPSNFMIANGVGLQAANGTVASGLAVSVMGSSAAVSALKTYTPTFLQIDLQLYPIPGQGPRHMIFRRDGDTHVLPAAFRVVAQNPPVITELASVKDDAGQPFLEIRGYWLQRQFPCLLRRRARRHLERHGNGPARHPPRRARWAQGCGGRAQRR